jgi:hypothetical protein
MTLACPLASLDHNLIGRHAPTWSGLRAHCVCSRIMALLGRCLASLLWRRVAHGAQADQRERPSRSTVPTWPMSKGCARGRIGRRPISDFCTALTNSELMSIAPLRCLHAAITVVAQKRGRSLFGPPCDPWRLHFPSEDGAMRRPGRCPRGCGSPAARWCSTSLRHEYAEAICSVAEKRVRHRDVAQVCRQAEIDGRACGVISTKDPCM